MKAGDIRNMYDLINIATITIIFYTISLNYGKTLEMVMTCYFYLHVL